MTGSPHDFRSDAYVFSERYLEHQPLCPFHDGDSRDPLRCDCERPTV